MNPKLEALRTQFNEYLTQDEEIKNRAIAEGRDLSDEEAAQSDEILARAFSLKPQIEAEVEKATKVSDTAALFAKVSANTPENSVRANVNKELEFSDVAKLAIGQVRARINYDGGRSQEQYARALTQVTSTSSAGSLRENIVGEIIRFVDPSRRTVNSLTQQARPAGGPWTVLVETGEANVATQGSEGAEIVSSIGSLSKVTIDSATYAGGIRLTLQSLYEPQPSSEELWSRSVAEKYATVTNTVVAAALKTAASSTVPLPVSGTTGVNSNRVIEAILFAVDSIYSASKTAADTIWVSPDVRRWLASIVDTTGAPIFPMLNPNNRNASLGGFATFDGINFGDLRFVVEPAFATSTFIVGASKWGTVYEYMYPELQAWDVATLEKQIAIAGELGTYFRSEGFIELVDTDGNTSATPNFG